VRKIDVIPVFHREVGGFEDQPDEGRPGDHQKEFLGPAEDEGVTFQVINDPIDGEDIGPPGKAIEPTVERIDFFEEEDFRDKKESNSNDPMNGKNLSHGGLI
jgi:hypothetical protein